MNLARRARLELLVLVEIAIAAFCVSQRSIGLFLVAGGLAALSWYVVEGPRGRTLPRWLSNLLVVAIVANVVREWLVRPDPAEAIEILGRFALWLSCLKLFESRRPRDDSQVLALTAVLVVSGALHSIDLLFALLLLVYGIDAMRVAMLLELLEASGGAATGTTPAPGSRFAPRLRRSAAVTIAAATLVALVVFVLFPRRLDSADRRGLVGAPVPGFVEEVDLFSGERISESRREVFSVRWLDRAGESVQLSSPPLLRGSVMEDYQPDEGKWTSLSQRRRMRTVTVRPDLEMTPISRPPVTPRSETYRQQVVMRSMATDTVFAAFAPIAIASPERRSFGVDVRTLIIREIGLERLSRLQRYEVQVEPFPGPDTLAPLFGGGGAVIPEPPSFPVPRVREVAEQLIEDLDLEDVPSEAAAEADPAERWIRNRRIARAFADWLRGDGGFAYSTDLRDFVRLEGEDPIVSFLERYRFGHCEYFASALTALCRSVGVDARLVTGFIAMEWDEGGEQYLVRESNAHAWVEVRVGEHQWISVDPTPAESLEAMAAARRSWLDRWRWMYDRIELFWNSRIVSYDGAVQASLVERLSREWSERVEESLSGAAGRAREIVAGLRLGAAVVPWLIAALVTVAAAFLAAVLWRRRARRTRRLARLPVGGGRRLLELARIHVESLQAWERAGWPRAGWIPPGAFVDSLPAGHAEEVAATRAILDLYYAARYGARPLAERDLREARALLRRVTAGVRASRGSPV